MSEFGSNPKRELSIVSNSNARSLESILDELSLYGDPSLFKSSSSGLGWLCRVEVFVTGKGVTFEVKSDFKDKKPIDAAAACLENVKNAVSSLKKLDDF